MLYMLLAVPTYPRHTSANTHPQKTPEAYTDADLDHDEAFRPISFHFLLVVLVAGERGGVALGEEQVQHATVDNQQADDAVHA